MSVEEVYFLGGGPLDGFRRIDPTYPDGYHLKVVVAPARERIAVGHSTIPVEKRDRVGHYEVVRSGTTGQRFCVWRGVSN